MTTRVNMHQDYIRSEEWRARRVRFKEEWSEEHEKDTPLYSVISGATENIQVHHMTYDGLEQSRWAREYWGREMFHSLLPLTASEHTTCHNRFIDPIVEAGVYEFYSQACMVGTFQYLMHMGEWHHPWDLEDMPVLQEAAEAYGENRPPELKTYVRENADERHALRIPTSLRGILSRMPDLSPDWGAGFGSMLIFWLTMLGMTALEGTSTPDAWKGVAIGTTGMLVAGVLVAILSTARK